MAFQRIFNLNQDGIVGKSTWYKISYIYVAVTKLAELTSEGERLPTNGNYPGFALRRGNQGVEVQEAQYYLDLVSDVGTSLVAQMVKHLPTVRETWVQSLGQEDLLEKEMEPTPVLLPGILS